MFSPAQASVSPRPLPPIPTQAMFNLLLRFWPRKSAGTPNANAPAARELVLINSRRPTRGSEGFSDFFIVGILGIVSTRNRIHTRRHSGEQESRNARLAYSLS